MTATGLAHSVVVLAVRVVKFYVQIVNKSNCEYEIRYNRAMGGKERSLEASVMLFGSGRRRTYYTEILLDRGLWETGKHSLTVSYTDKGGSPSLPPTLPSHPTSHPHPPGDSAFRLKASGLFICLIVFFSQIPGWFPTKPWRNWTVSASQRLW